VYVLNSDARIFLAESPSTLTDANFDVVCNNVISHPDCKALSGADYLVPKSVNCHVVDPIDYERFDEWHGTQTADEFGTSWAIWPTAIPTQRPVSTVIFVFDEPADAQAYTFSIRGQFYTRWPLNTIGNQASHEVPLADNTKLQKALRDSR
jgi:hypothetical protein